MKVLRYNNVRDAQIVETATPSIKPSQCLAKSIASNVSAGTELAFYRGVAPQFSNKSDQNGLWGECPGNIKFPMQSNDPGCWWMGYASVAKIVEVGSDVKDLKVGDVVFTHQSHKEYQVIESDYYNLPSSIDPIHATFTMLSEISFNGILDSQIKLVDNVVIFGMGTIGQLLAQMAKLSGAYTIAVDYIEPRLELARKLGADFTINPAKDGDAAKKVIEKIGSCADVVIEASGNVKALPDAIRCVRKDGQVTVLSFYVDTPSTLYLGREFHHNRVVVRSSQIGGVEPSISHQYNWNSRAASVLKLLEKIQIEPLISHRCKFSEYPEMLKVIDKDSSKCQSVVITY